MTEITALLEQKMMTQTVLSQTGLNRTVMREMLSDARVRNCMKKLLPVNRRLSCKEIYHCFEPVMKERWETPAEGWIPFAYDCATHILYPEKAFTKEKGGFFRGACFLLAVLQFFFDEERKVIQPEPFYDFELLTEEEAAPYGSGEEYETFLRLFRSQYIYEMMRLNLETTTFKTLEHIAGVHYVAMHIAKSLEAAEVPVDVALVSASAAGHDLGKFGCKPGENVPYLHYFYTNAWFQKHGMHYIGHIAANHSTWDLEPDNLSLESLILIYSDFRVKSSRGKDGENITIITSLKDAFDVILHKLENVDEKKLLRYKQVYAKLKSFEDYMEMKGVDTTLNGTGRRVKPFPEVTLQNGRQTIRSLTFMGVERGIDVMRRMVAERAFGNLLEAARSEKDWKNLRAYLDVFGRYIAYTNDLQKKQTLDFLYELLMHREGDVCVEAAHLTGKIIAQFNFGYRKRRPAHFPDTDTRMVMKLWSDTMERIIRPDYRLTTVQQRRIRRSLKHALTTLVEYADAEDLKLFLTCFMELFEKGRFTKDAEIFVILDAVQILSATPLSEAQRETVGYYIAEKMRSTYRPVQVTAWRAARWLVDYDFELSCYEKIGEVAKRAKLEEDSTLLFLQYRILSKLGKDTTAITKVLYERDRVSDIFLDNLKTATPWIVKAVNIKLLKDQVMQAGSIHHLHIASHLSNLLKVSEHVSVRQDAGDALIEIMPILTPDERNDVVVELVRGLEMGEYEFSKYVPAYLGKAALFLAPKELDEIVAHVYGLTSSPNTRVVASALDTASVLLCNYPEYKTRFPEEKETYEARRNELLGMILRGLSSYRTAVREEAMLDLSSVFTSKELQHTEKKQLFELSARKILFLLSEEDDTQITMFYRTAVLSEIMRFITECDLRGEALRIPMRKKVAFFPGTFDPFTLSHKGIARMIRDMDFEVYLAIDEFSWSKKVQPHLVRRRIVSMSVADEFHINLFPDDIPINIANPDNLETLSRIFKGREVYMVVGSDVIMGASSYKKEPTPYSIHHMNHIAFRRVGEDKYDSKKNPEMFKVIRGDVVELELPTHLEEISSTMIRENIDLNRDISNLIDPGVQEYIYGSGLYLREPEYKPFVSGKVISFEETEKIGAKLEREIIAMLPMEQDEARRVLETGKRRGDHLLLLRNQQEKGRLTGVIMTQHLKPDSLYQILGDVELADEVRRHTSGEVLLIAGIHVCVDSGIYDAEQYLLAEAIARSLPRGCSYALYFPEDGHASSQAISAVRRQGFVRARGENPDIPLYLVDMQQPLVLLRNMQTTIKEPLASNGHVLHILEKTHQDLQLALTGLYPGQLVLSISASVIYPQLVEKITKLNGVPNEPTVPRTLGECMCVPYGKILRDKVVPNTVTKTLHTDKVFTPDLSVGTIEAFHNYPKLEDQIRMIRAFNREVILVDDLLHQGGRFEALNPLFEREGIGIRKVLLGMLSGYGRDTMALHGVDVDCVYFIPNLRGWLVESTLYPFIGGDTVERPHVQVAGLSPSINMIYPYTKPILKGSGQKSLYDFSACCIKNARDIFLTLEEEYRALFGRNLTLGRLSEAVIAPLCPDRGQCVGYDENLGASVYLENDLQMLNRTQ